MHDHFWSRVSLINCTNSINGQVPSLLLTFDHLPRNTLNINEFVSREPHATRLGDLDNEKEENNNYTVVTIEQRVGR